MYRSGQCKCVNCGEFYLPDERNRGRQKYCKKPECRRASKRESQRRWRDKPENREHFKGEWNVKRVQAWRAAHPGYWRRRRRPNAAVALQEISTQQPVRHQKEAEQDVSLPLQDLLKSQDPLVLGLVIQLADTALQEDIAGLAQRLITRGRAAMGQCPGGPNYAKTNPRTRTGAACAATL
jgi:hypothetical protein